MRETNKSRQKHEQRMRRVRGEKRPDPVEQEKPEHEKPVNQQPWIKQIFQPTLFDVVRALQEGQSLGVLDIPKLDSWGVTFLVTLILNFFTGTYARVLDTPYRLPKMPLGQAGPNMEAQGSEAGVPRAFTTGDLYELFAETRAHRGALVQGDRAMGSGGKVALQKERAKRDDAGQRNANEAVNPLENAVVYPEDRLSPWMRGLINSVESVFSLLGPPLRKIGFEPDEKIDVKIVRSSGGATGIQPQKMKMTAAEFAMYVTTERSPGYAVVPMTGRGRELKNLLTDSEKYREESFFSKEAIHPIKHKYKHDGMKAIGDKFAEKGVFMEHMATLYHVRANVPGEDISSDTARTYDADLGTIVRLEGETPRFFAIIPHHPDLVIPAVDPTSELAFGEWMQKTGKYLFFRDADALDSETYFFSTEESRNNIAHPNDTLRGAVAHTLKPIISETMKHMTDLVVNETPAERVLNKVLGLFVPFYDVGKALKDGNYEQAMVFLSFEMIPYVGKGAKLLFKTTFKGVAARAAADQVGKWAGKAFKKATEWGGSDAAADFVADRAKKREE
jgi:hypothetical protein